MDLRKKPPKRRRRQPSGRQAGGQPGHRGQTRELIPVDEVDEVITLKPSSCAVCHHELVGEDPQPHRHQLVSRIELLRNSADASCGDRISGASIGL